LPPERGNGKLRLRKNAMKTKIQKPRKIAAAEPRRYVLVGTYRGDQLTGWRGWYNYPISDEDRIES